MTGLVLDSSVIVALLADGGELGDWAADVVAGHPLAAPALAAVEAANVLRREELTGRLSDPEATGAHQDVVSLPVDWWPYPVLAARAWELRHHVTVYDATYVALAERLAVPLVTLDRRLARAPGPRCEVVLPPPT